MKTKFAHAEAISVANRLVSILAPFCERIQVAGSLRRKKREVSDIEILFVGKVTLRQVDLFSEGEFNLALEKIDSMVGTVLAKRLNVNGQVAWGDQNRLAVHVESGIPVDLFSTTEPKWANSLVCRTGGKANNLVITMAANRMGWSFEAYGRGLHKLDGLERYDTKSEADVFRFLNLPYLQPEDRP